MGMITPARTGDPIGKSIFYRPSDRWRVVVLSFAGSIIQNAVIFITAVLALFTIGSDKNHLQNRFLSYYPNLDNICIWSIMAITLIITLLLIIFKPNLADFVQKLNTHLSIFKEHNIKSLIKVTIITAVRYLVFSLQFYLLLRFFGLTNIQDGVLSVFIYYGALSFLPSTGAGDLGLRASLALLIFGQTTLMGPAIVMASLLLWFFNLGIPALIPSLSGIPLALKQKFQKETLPIS